MLDVGAYHNLIIDRDTPPGLYLRTADGSEEVLLPNKYKPEAFQLDDELTVFVYLDHEERPVATTLDPLIQRNSFAYLECTQLTDIGAFVDWGLEKELLVPFAEQVIPMRAGEWYVVYMYLDEKSNRLVGSTVVQRYLDKEPLSLKRFDKVDLLVSHISDLGANVIINGKYSGLIHRSDIFEDLRTGDRLPGYIRRVREDGKIDVVMQEEGYKSIEPNAEYLYQELKANDGKLYVHDKSKPEEIQATLGLSKKSFKKAVGALYKDRKIVLEKDGIRLVD
ncbi:CvfB family protein [Croceiramulus getboli]|nr:S1-like domain-containing RNA-binding protein [Flavobacteriaceae bacterium YJPT1-3]